MNSTARGRTTLLAFCSGVKLRKTIKCHGCNMRHKLPDTPPLDLCLFHWSPSGARRSINRFGLRTHQKSLQGDWRPPYVCFSDDPVLAWSLSGAMWPEILSWDLWMIHVPSSSLDHYEIILDTYRDSGQHYIKEYRIYERVYKRDLVYVATREQL